MTCFEWIYTVWNALVLLLYAYDKLQSKRHGKRVPEKVLLGCGVLFGALGAFCGMYLFRHKTRHRQFWICNVFFLVLQGIGLIFYCFTS